MARAHISSYDPEDRVNGDLVKITDGSLTIFNKIGGVRRQGAILTRVSAGLAPLGGWTTLDGYFTAAPEVRLSPKRMPTYLTSLHPGTQSVSFSCEVREKGEPGKYEIKPVVNVKMKAVAKAASPAVTYTGSWYDAGPVENDPWDQSWWPSNVPFMTGWYPAIGDLTVDFSYRTEYRFQFLYPITVNVALDVATSYYPAMGAVQKSYVSNAAGGAYSISGSDSISYAGPKSLYSWRLRRNVNFGYPVGRASGYAIYKDSFSFNRYSFSCAAQSKEMADSDLRVFYLAIGR